ncbi:MAG: nucleotide exchange factor GrpE [Azoarcus sp.]|jgi:molecular chaperone GrpE|nr:nucleotide exchange factor GrpE [Azoarcus sp.]
MPAHPAAPDAPVPSGDTVPHSVSYAETPGTLPPLTSESIELNFGPPPAPEQAPAEQTAAEQTPPEPFPAAPVIDPNALLAEAENRLAQAEARAAEYYDAWLRARAETENARRRGQEDTAKASKFAAEKFAAAMLPVKDSLEAALATEGQTPEKLREGVELTLRQLIAAFEGAQLVAENPLGQKFDPNKHQAINALESEAEPNTVLHVLQKGYLLHGRVIRPAMVMVAKAKT